MARWITFDQNTANQIRSRVPMESVFEAPGRNALEYALSSSGNVVAVLDAGIANRRAVALFRRLQTEEHIPAEHRAMRASGILGLGDEAVFEEEESTRAKSWWRKVWED